jgi:hypothetical protein
MLLIKGIHLVPKPRSILFIPLQALFTSLESATNNLCPGFRAERLGSLNWCADSTVNDELGEYTESTRHTEENSVVTLLVETVN